MFTALLFILGSVIIIVVPVYLSIILVSPKINSLLNNRRQAVQGLQIFTDESTKTVTAKISSYIPGLFNSTANLLANLRMLFFLLYYLLINGTAIEKYLNKIIPLRSENVKANALGFPIICLV